MYNNDTNPAKSERWAAAKIIGLNGVKAIMKWYEPMNRKPIMTGKLYFVFRTR
jgi:hypothetical protein